MFWEEERSLAHLQQDAAAVAASAATRNLLYKIEFAPGADPGFVCDSFQQASNFKYECSCGYAPDKSVEMSCLDVEGTCNIDSSLCFKQNVNMGLTTENVIKEIETCTQYTHVNLTKFEGSSTKFANYSYITPCVKVIPQTVGDFSSLESCSASINELPCYKCEICNDNAPALGITMDCCNTNPDGEQLKVDCGPVGGGGAFAPFFDSYVEGEMEECSGVQGAETGLLSLLVYVASALMGAYFC